MNFDVVVQIRRKDGIADPEGSTIERALPALGFSDTTGVTVGKVMWMQVEAADADAARVRVDELCERLLTNPVIEDATILIEPGKGT